MDAVQALADARGYALAGRVRFTKHGTNEMKAAFADVDDVMNALIKGTHCGPGDRPGRWRITGPDLSGTHDLTVVVVFENGVLVVTVW